MKEGHRRNNGQLDAQSVRRRRREVREGLGTGIWLLGANVAVGGIFSQLAVGANTIGEYATRGGTVAAIIGTAIVYTSRKS